MWLVEFYAPWYAPVLTLCPVRPGMSSICDLLMLLQADAQSRCAHTSLDPADLLVAAQRFHRKPPLAAYEGIQSCETSPYSQAAKWRVCVPRSEPSCTPM